jgi:hypothetical protein
VSGVILTPELGGRPASAAWPLLTRDHCLCCSCGELFNSTKAFDQHRVGRYPRLRGGRLVRRCLTAEEMQARGMTLGVHGWLTRRRKVFSWDEAAR